MRTYKQWHTLLLLALLALSLQSCLGIGDNTNGNFHSKGVVNGTQINISDQALFKGKIYLTLDRNLFVLDERRNLKQLTNGVDVRDPAVSPNGKWIAFSQRYKNYADLDMIPSNGGKITVLRSGIGRFEPNPNSPAGTPMSTFLWYTQPAWRDNTHLAFLSDLAKPYADSGVDDFLLDLQIFQISLNNPKANPQTVAYAHYGDGGDRDPAFRPHHPDQLIYTHYQQQYDDTAGTKQINQIFFENADAIVNNPSVYKPGVFEYDPAIPITPGTPDLTNMQPAFSPDGNSIAYIRRMDVTHMGLFVMPTPPDDVLQNPNSNASEQKALQAYNKSSLIVQGQMVSQPVWSPDGTQIAYINYTNNVFDLWLATVSKDAKTGAYKIKGDPIQLTDSKGKLDADSRPFWTP